MTSTMAGGGASSSGFSGGNDGGGLNDNANESRQNSFAKRRRCRSPQVVFPDMEAKCSHDIVGQPTPTTTARTTLSPTASPTTLPSPDSYTTATSSPTVDACGMEPADFIMAGKQQQQQDAVTSESVCVVMTNVDDGTNNSNKNNNHKNTGDGSSSNKVDDDVVPIRRVIAEMYWASPLLWTLYFAAIVSCRTLVYFSQRALGDLVADAPYLGRYDSVSNDAKFYMHVFGFVIAESVFLLGCFTTCFSLQNSRNHLFERLLSAVQNTSVSAHETAHRSGLLMANFKDNMEKLDNAGYTIAYFFGYFAYTLFVNVFIIEAFYYAAIAVGLLLALWVVLYVWYAARQTILSHAVLKTKSTFAATSTVVVGKVFEIRSHGLGPFLSMKLKGHVLNAANAEYNIEVWARYIELIIDVLISLFCMLFCLYVVIDLTTLADKKSMSRAEVTQTISTRAMGAFYAFAWKSTMSPLVIETNDMMSLLTAVGQMIGLTDQLNREAEEEEKDGNGHGRGEEGKTKPISNTACSRSNDGDNKKDDIIVVADECIDNDSSFSSSLSPSPFSLRLRGVEMRYSPHMPLVLKGLTFEAKEGTLTVIKGSSGCGKSSMFLALLGLYPICGGDISLSPAEGREKRNIQKQHSQHLKKNNTCATADDEGKMGNQMIEKSTASPFSSSSSSSSISSTPIKAWRRLFSWIPQEPFLFEGTVVENLFPEVDPCHLTEEHFRSAAQALIDVNLLTKAAWDAEMNATNDDTDDDDDDENPEPKSEKKGILSILRLSENEKDGEDRGNFHNHHHFSSPPQLSSGSGGGSILFPSSIVDAQGENLSGGERQRIGIARALLNTTARVFIVDEPTSHLDSASCTEMLQIVKKRLCGDRRKEAEFFFMNSDNDNTAEITTRTSSCRCPSSHLSQLTKSNSCGSKKTAASPLPSPCPSLLSSLALSLKFSIDTFPFFRSFLFLRASSFVSSDAF